MPSGHLAPWTETEREQLRLLRLENGWSFREMAARIGMPEPTLRNILEAGAEPLQTTVFKIRRWLEAYRSAVAS